MYCFKCNKFIKFVNLEMSYIFDKTLILLFVVNALKIMMEHLKKTEVLNIKNSWLN